MMSVEAWAPIGSVAIATVALIGSWWRWRVQELRRDEVLAWSQEVITALQVLWLLCKRDEKKVTVTVADYHDIWLSTSTLLERGRLFFRNAQPERYGQQKEPAYRGFRPLILDQLLLAHQIAEKYPSAATDERSKMCQIAEKCRARFVTLAQKEVGRARTRSADTSAGGSDAELDYLLKNYPKH